MAVNRFDPAELRARILAAAERIAPHVRRTPLEPSPHLSRLCGGRVFLKLENQQLTGSFKLRGAFNKILTLEGPSRGVIAASTGNHGSACAYALGRLGLAGTVYMPRHASAAKVDMIRLYGADVQFVGDDCVEAEMAARQAAETGGQTYVSPYNDWEVIAGQGTVALEIEQDLPDCDAVLVPVGGGGLIAGMAASLVAGPSTVEIVGCLPENAATVHASVRAGEIVTVPNLPTLSDGTAGAMEPGSITFPLCRDLVDRYVLVSEAEIAAAMIYLIEKHYLLVEGAAALSVAALLKEPERFRDRTLVLVISGCKISLACLRRLLV